MSHEIDSKTQTREGHTFMSTSCRIRVVASEDDLLFEGTEVLKAARQTRTRTHRNTSYEWNGATREDPYDFFNPWRV